MSKWIALCSFIIVVTISSTAFAGGSGTLTVVCKYVDDSKIEQPLSDAYVYLHDGSTKPHGKPSYVFGPSDLSGRITASVPEGSYYVRITKRNPQGQNPNKLGPPEPMDYTWSQTSTIRIRANVTTDLGIVYAGFFTAPISITGTVTRTSGDPAPSLYVRVQTEPCYTDVDNGKCSQTKVLTRKRTDANGQYTLALREPGTYYIYVSACPSDRGEDLSGVSSCKDEYGGAVTVNMGESKTLNIVAYY